MVCRRGAFRLGDTVREMSTGLVIAKVQEAAALPAWKRLMLLGSPLLLIGSCHVLAIGAVPKMGLAEVVLTPFVLEHAVG